VCVCVPVAGAGHDLEENKTKQNKVNWEMMKYSAASPHHSDKQDAVTAHNKHI